MTELTRTEQNPDSPDALDTTETNPERHPDQSDVTPSVAGEPELAQTGEPAQPVEPRSGSAPVSEGATLAGASPAGERDARVPVETVDLTPVRRAMTPRRAPTPKAAPRGPWPLKPYAIVETGGKQYRVSIGDRISIEKLPEAAGGEVTFDRVLLLGGDGSTEVGTPVVDGASVVASVDDHFRGEKLVIFKYKAKKRYRRRTGHRQSLTHVTITGISR